MASTATAVRRPILRTILRRAPVCIGAGLLFISWFYLMWNITVAQVIPALHFRTNKTLAGVVRESMPELNFDSFASYKFQTFVSREIGTLSPIYRPAIRWKNQIFYSAFGMSGISMVTVGRDRQLFQKEYLDDYCSRDLTRFTPEAEKWAASIRRMQDFFETRGTPFLYVITPSKPAVYPDKLPAGFACPARPYDQQHKLTVWHEMLDRQGIHYVDTATLVAEAKSHYDMPMFPQGGIHWNMLSASLGAEAVTERLNQMFGRQVLTPFTITWARSFDPQGSDRDLLEILNLMYPDKRYEVPVVTLHPGPHPDDCKPLRMTQVGGSFLFELDDALARLPCAPIISDWFYWDLKHFVYPGGTDKPLPVDAAARQRALLEDLDVMIFEENEAVIPNTAHGRRLLEMIEGLQKTTER